MERFSGRAEAVPNGGKVLFASRRCYFPSVSGPFVILVVRLQVNMTMMMVGGVMVVLMMAPERAQSPSWRQQEEEKRCFPPSARTHHNGVRNI